MKASGQPLHGWRLRDLPLPSGDDKKGRNEHDIQLCGICAQTIDVEYSKYVGSCFGCGYEGKYMCSQCTHKMKIKYGEGGKGKLTKLPDWFFGNKDYPELDSFISGLVLWTDKYRGFGQPFACDMCEFRKNDKSIGVKRHAVVPAESENKEKKEKKETQSYYAQVNLFWLHQRSLRNHFPYFPTNHGFPTLSAARNDIHTQLITYAMNERLIDYPSEMFQEGGKLLPGAVALLRTMFEAHGEITFAIRECYFKFSNGERVEVIPTEEDWKA